MTKKNGEHTNIIVWVDDFSKFVLLRELQVLTSAAVAELFEKEVLWQFGKPL